MMKVPNDFYHQFEELNYKLDALLEKNKTLKTNKQSETKIVVNVNIKVYNYVKVKTL